MTRASSNLSFIKHEAVHSNSYSFGSKGAVRAAHRKHRAWAIKLVIVASSSLALGGFASIAGCQNLMPLALQWGADLISTASQNYSKKYSNEVERLLLAMYADKVAGTGLNQRVGGTQAMPGTYGSVPQSGPYGQGATAYPPANGAYPSQPGQPSTPYNTGAYGSTNSLETPQGSPYGQGSTAYPPASGAYPPQPGQSSPYGAGGTGGPIVLDAALLVQRASDRSAYRLDPVPIQDGDTLRDGGADPRRGDAIKFSFRVNCDCYVYIIGVDATGYVARVFPDPTLGQANPVRAQQQYVVPEGSVWYGLDQVKGVEQVFFFASRVPRQDIDRTLTQLAQTPRTRSVNYRSLKKAAIPDRATRGLVKVQMGTPSAVQGQSGQQYSFTPQAFGTQAGADDIVVTRWFNHE